MIKACQSRAVNPGRLWSTSHTGGGGLATGSGPKAGTFPGQGVAPNPPLSNDGTAQMPGWASNPALAQEQLVQWQFLQQRFQLCHYQQQLAAASPTLEPWQMFPPSDGESTGSQSSMGVGMDPSVTVPSCARRKGSNREPGWCVDAQHGLESDWCGNAQSRTR